MKEIMRFSHYEAKDDSIFSDRDQCEIYETILNDAPAFLVSISNGWGREISATLKKHLGFIMIKLFLSILLQMMNYLSPNVIWIDMV